MFSLGEAVRVTSADKTCAGKGMIAMVNGDSTFDIIYSTSKLENDEESAVHSDRIKHLLKEEVDLAESNDAEVWKNIGNSVFALKDYDAAIAYYKRALALLTPTTGDNISIGQSVIVSYNDTLDCQNGIISDINDGVADVMFDDSEQEEETDIPFKRLTPMASGLKNILLQRSIYMNLARCVLKQEQKGWAIKYSSFALAISHHLETLLTNNEANENDAKITENEVNKYLADGYYFRGKALLQAHRPKFAAQVHYWCFFVRQVFALLTLKLLTCATYKKLSYSVCINCFFLTRRTASAFAAMKSARPTPWTLIFKLSKGTPPRAIGSWPETSPRG